MQPPTLSQVCQMIVDCEHKTAPTQQSGYASIRTPNIGRGRLILEDVNRVSEEAYREWTRRAVPQGGDLILAREAPVGNVAIVPEDLDLCLGQRTVLIRPDREQIVPEYLVYLLLGNEIQARFSAYASGATVPHLNVRDIRDLELPPLPAISTQRKIATILSAYDDLIENNTRRIAILEEMAQLLYREWFVLFRFPGYEDVEMVDSELGAIPAGWEVNKLSKLAEKRHDRIEPNEFRDELFSYHSFPAFDHDSLPELTLGAEIRSAKYFVHKGCVLLSRLNPRIPRVWLPRLSGKHRAIASTEFVVLLPRSPATRAYLYGLCKSADFRARLVGLTGGTSTSHQRVNHRDLMRMKITCPSPGTVERFSRIAQPILKLSSSLRLRNVAVREARDLLLPRLVSGELDVRDLPIDSGQILSID